MKLSYGPSPLQFGHLRVPAGPGTHPVVVVIHGGFWRATYNLEHIEPVCEALCAAGFATWNLEYRCIGSGGGWPTTYHDIARGAAFVKELAARFPLNAARTIALGHSAGGHLALLLGAHELVKGVVSLAGVADLRRASDLRLSRGVVEEFLSSPEQIAEASPIELLPIRVPVRIVHGVADDIVPHEIGARYTEAAKARGCDVELISLPNTGHFEIIDPGAAQWAAVREQIERISAMV